MIEITRRELGVGALRVRVRTRVAGPRRGNFCRRRSGKTTVGVRRKGAGRIWPHPAPESDGAPRRACLIGGSSPAVGRGVGRVVPRVGAGGRVRPAGEWHGMAGGSGKLGISH